MMTTTANLATPAIVREKKFKIKICACVKEESTHRILIDNTDHEFIVTPPEHCHRSQTVLHSKIELMAREQYSAGLWERITNDSSLDAKLANREWYIFTKTKKITPLF